MARWAKKKGVNLQQEPTAPEPHPLAITDADLLAQPDPQSQPDITPEPQGDYVYPASLRKTILNNMWAYVSPYEPTEANPLRR